MKKQISKEMPQPKLMQQEDEFGVPEAPPANEKKISSAGLHTGEYDRSSYQPNQGLRRPNKP